MSMNLKHFVEWVNRCGEELCELYDMFLEETNTSQYDVSILDFQLHMYKNTKNYIHNNRSYTIGGQK